MGDIKKLFKFLVQEMYNKLHKCDAIKYMELQLEVLEFGSWKCWNDD